MDTLGQELHEAAQALTVFDAERLEAMEERMRSVTAEQLALWLDGGEERLSEVLRTHSLLGQLADRTAAHLKVLVSVMQLTSDKVTTGQRTR